MAWIRTGFGKPPSNWASGPQRTASTRMVFHMSIKTKLAAVALATLAVAGSIASTTSQAEAKPLGWGWGVGAGIATAAIVGTAVAASSQPHYYGYRRCGWVAQYNAYGQFVGNVRTCY